MDIFDRGRNEKEPTTCRVCGRTIKNFYAGRVAHGRVHVRQGEVTEELDAHGLIVFRALSKRATAGDGEPEPPPSAPDRSVTPPGAGPDGGSDLEPQLSESGPEEDILAAADELAGLTETERLTVVQARRGQGQYRRALIARWRKCAVSGVTDHRLLRASHLKPWRSCSNAERIDPANGLLLVASLDAAVDRLLVTFDDSGSIRISPTLKMDDRRRAGISLGMSISSVRTDLLPYLREHHRLYELAHPGQ